MPQVSGRPNRKARCPGEHEANRDGKELTMAKKKTEPVREWIVPMRGIVYFDVIVEARTAEEAKDNAEVGESEECQGSRMIDEVEVDGEPELNE